MEKTPESFEHRLYFDYGKTHQNKLIMSSLSKNEKILLSYKLVKYTNTKHYEKGRILLVTNLAAYVCDPN